MSQLRQITERFAGTKLLVLGDLMLDRYTWGDAERVSPEAPVLVLRAETEEARPGGAASVASLLRHLDAEVTLAGVVGDDPEGRTLLRILDDVRVCRECVYVDESRPTTTKERFLGRAANRHSHQILRVDYESRDALSPSMEEVLIESIVDQLRFHQALLISDYAKGVCTVDVLHYVIDAARSAKIPVLVDPARIHSYERYRGASFIKPNRFEAEIATGNHINTPTDALRIANQLCNDHQIESAFVTLDQDGIAAWPVATRFGTTSDVSDEWLWTDSEFDTCSQQSGGEIALAQGYFQPACQRQVYDITGAGDMVLAVAGICLANGTSLKTAAILSNAAAGLEIQRLGIAPVSWNEILAELNPSDPSRKLVTLEEITTLVASYRSAGNRIVFTNGCFDLLHIGHVTCLQQAAALGDVLIVAINSDSSISRLKGTSRPLIRQQDRAEMLAALSCVAHVVVFNDDTPNRLLQEIRPDVLVKGGTTKDVVGREIVEAYGGQVCTVGQVPGISTTNLVASIKETSCT